MSGFNFHGTTPMSNTVAAQSLISKHSVKTDAENILTNPAGLDSVNVLERVDSTNEKHIENIVGPSFRALKRYPFVYDTLSNIIQKARRKGVIERVVKDYNADYYIMALKEETLLEFLGLVADHTQRQSLKRQFFLELQGGFVTAKGRFGEYTDAMQPFRINRIRRFESGETRIIIELLKDVFGALITGECFKSGGDGFIKLPSGFYALLTHADTRLLTSPNPLYKLQVLASLRNTNNKGSVTVPSPEFYKSVIPEMVRILPQGGLKLESSRHQTHMIIKWGIDGVKDVYREIGRMNKNDNTTKINDIRFVRDLYLDSKETIIYLSEGIKDFCA